MPGAAQMPLWFIEGMAEYVSLGPLDPHTAMWMRDAALQRQAPQVAPARRSALLPLPLRPGAVGATSPGRWGDEIVGRLLRSASKASDMDQAFLRETGMVGRRSSTPRGRPTLQDTYQPLQAQTDSPSALRRAPDRRQATRRTGLNVGPVVSPDGSRIVFYSARDLFSIDMFLANAHTGQVLQRVTRTATDPHFQSLEFINSAGSFDG